MNTTKDNKENYLSKREERWKETMEELEEVAGTAHQQQQHRHPPHIVVVLIVVTTIIPL
jgi:hypothetical protein